MNAVVGTAFRFRPARTRAAERAAAVDHDLAALLDAGCGKAPRTLALSVHVPFCLPGCTHHGCGGAAFDAAERARFVPRVLAEAARAADALGAGDRIASVHLGGTPTALHCAELRTLLRGLATRLPVADDAARSVDVDPRGVDARKLETLVAAGHDDLHLDIVDLDPDVQRAIGREEPTSLVLRTVGTARALGARRLRFDLVTGLPGQSPEGFAHTLVRLVEMRPDRIRLRDRPPGSGPGVDPTDLGFRPDAVRALRTAAARVMAAAGYVAEGLDDHVAGDLAPERESEAAAASCAAELGLGPGAPTRIGSSHFVNPADPADWAAAVDAGRWSVGPRPAGPRPARRAPDAPR